MITESKLRENHQAAYTWAVQLCNGDAVQAKDVLQETYLKILRGKAKFSGRSNFKTWLFGVIRFTAGEYRRKHRRYAQRLNLLPRPDTATEKETFLPNGAILEKALAGLSSRQRQILMLVFYHSLSIDQAAAVMNIAPGTARTHYTRGKDSLQKALMPYKNELLNHE